MKDKFNAKELLEVIKSMKGKLAMRKIRNKFTRLFLAILCLSFFAGYCVFAADSTNSSATVMGKVIDETGLPVAGAQVHILLYEPQVQTPGIESKQKEAVSQSNYQKSNRANMEKAESAREKLVLTTDQNGNFAISAMAGEYQIVSIKKEGYEFNSSSN